MNDHFITTLFCYPRYHLPTNLETSTLSKQNVPAGIILVAVVAARYFQNNLERALLPMGQTGYIPRHCLLSISRFNRQLHRYLGSLEICVSVLLEMAFVSCVANPNAQMLAA